VDAGFAVRLAFGDLLTGPLALGYGCHFGLGLFAALEDQP
jgi:CRISPR-associated protein Csb2